MKKFLSMILACSVLTLTAISVSAGSIDYRFKESGKITDVTCGYVDAAENNTVYIAHDANIYSYDMANLSNPNHLDGDIVGYGNVKALKIRNNYLFAAYEEQLRIFDVTNPNNPAQIAHYTYTADKESFDAAALAFGSDGYVYLSVYNTWWSGKDMSKSLGLIILKADDEALRAADGGELTAVYKNKEKNSGRVYNTMCASGNYLYGVTYFFPGAANPHPGTIEMLDISDRTNPVIKGAHQVTYTKTDGNKNVAEAGTICTNDGSDYVYISYGDSQQESANQINGVLQMNFKEAKQSDTALTDEEIASGSARCSAKRFNIASVGYGRITSIGLIGEFLVTSALDKNEFCVYRLMDDENGGETLDHVFWTPDAFENMYRGTICAIKNGVIYCSDKQNGMKCFRVPDNTIDNYGIAKNSENGSCSGEFTFSNYKEKDTVIGKLILATYASEGDGSRLVSVDMKDCVIPAGRYRYTVRTDDLSTDGANVAKLFVFKDLVSLKNWGNVHRLDLNQ